MTIVTTVVFGLSWLLAAWAFMLWGVDKLRCSYTLRVLDWNSRIEWIRGHRPSFTLLALLKLFQIGFVVWLAYYISKEIPPLAWWITIYKWLAIAVILFGSRKTVPYSLSVQVGGCEWISGRWVQMWKSGRSYKGLVLKEDGTLREGHISEETFQLLKKNDCDETVTVGLIPATLCFIAWACNGMGLIAAVVIFLW